MITAVLLFSQFVILRSPALLFLAGGYQFSALMAVPHALSFPRLFAPAGLIGAGPQTTAWLYVIWHAGFPLAVIGYALLRDRRRIQRTSLAIAMTCAVVVTIVCAAAFATTSGHSILPAIMRGDNYTPLLPVVIGITCMLSVLALLALWRGRPHSVLDVWLMVVMSAWIFDISLSAILNTGRFDLGFYTGRIYGLLAASVVLMVLLIETGAVYARQARTFEAERHDRDRQLQEVRSELIHVSRLTELGLMVSALVHEVNQPLSAVSSYIGAGLRLIQAGDTGKAEDALTRAAEQVTRAVQVIQQLRNLVKKDGSNRGAEDVQGTIEEAAALAMLGMEGRHIRLKMKFAPDMPPVLIDKVQIQQVLLNLIRNAIEAMEAGARRELVIGTTVSGNGMIDVSVTDSGPGLAPEIRDKLFQPFMTTKSAGLGVGLSICRTIVEGHGGHIWAADAPGGGTDFHFTVPVLVPGSAGRDPIAAVIPIAVSVDSPAALTWPGLPRPSEAAR